MTSYVYIVIDAEGHYGDYTSVFRQCAMRASAEKYIGASKRYRVLPIDADFSANYPKHHRIHREDVRQSQPKKRSPCHGKPPQPHRRYRSP